jgi:hypothetical protein
MLTTSTAKGMCAIKCPCFVTKVLHIRSECMAKHTLRLFTFFVNLNKKTNGKALKAHTTGSFCNMAPVLWILRKRGPDNSTLSPYSDASIIKARTGQIIGSASFA